MSDPLLRAREARIDVDDAAAIASVSLETVGRRLVVLGHGGPLLAALSGIPQGVAAAALHAATYGELSIVPGRAVVRSGELRLAGRDVASGEHLAIVGAAPFEPPLPGTWTAADYVLESTKLALLARHERASRAEIRRRSDEALEKSGMTAARKKSIQALHPVEKRVLVLAAAAASHPDVVVADRPLSGLEGQAAEFVHAALEGLLGGKGLVASVARMVPGTLEGTLARSASDIAAFVAGELSLFGPPDAVFTGRTIYRVAIRSNADRLRAALEERGASLDGGPVQFSLTLAPGQDASLVLRLASELRSAVVELVPVV